MKILTAAEMPEADRVTSQKFGVPSLTLMENAGSAVAEFVLKSYPQAKTIGVICGKGNNGGDGFVAARKLRAAGRRVQILMLADPKELRGDASKQFERLTAKSVLARTPGQLKSEPAGTVLASDVLIDAILGTGFKPPLNELHAAAIERVNSSQRPVVAVDLPSGLTADESTASNAPFVRADAIVTFTAPKPRLIFDPELATSKLFIADIGSPPEAIQSKLALEVITARDFEKALRPRPAHSHKGDYGHVLVIAGSPGKSGAAAMAGVAALRAGAGLVTVATPKSVQPLVAGFAAELMTEPLDETSEGTISRRVLANLEKLMDGKTVVALGPGLTTNSETVEFVREFVRQCSLPLVLDADGLNAFTGVSEKLNSANATKMLFLTPHPGEMARLLGCSTADVQKDRIGVARRFAQERGVVLVLKGFATLIALRDGTVWVNPTGNPAMAKGGMGDVLTGMLAGMISQFTESAQTQSLAAVYLHGLAGDLARDEADEHTILATDLLKTLPCAFHVARERMGYKLIRIR
jgi:ADP-dependent NAD(P)H-hydrate dehydratase / NAD(P)H-hydrate epimerase